MIKIRVNRDVIKMATSLYKFQVVLKTCDEHDHEELSCFCKTCRKFICTTCAKTTHIGHDWDFIPLVAKKLRKETPKLCRKIKEENMPLCREKVRTIDDNLSIFEKASDEDLKKLEEKRVEMISSINRVIDEQKRKREELQNREITTMREQSRQLRNKIKYLEKITSSLENNIATYTDYDVIEMEQDMLQSLKEVESHEISYPASNINFVPGEINLEQLEEMIGAIEEETAHVDGTINIIEVKTFKEFDRIIRTIAPISPTHGLISDNKPSVKLLSLQSNETQSKTLPKFSNLVALTNGDFICTSYSGQTIRHVTSAGKDSVIANTKPLYPLEISKTQNDDILVTLRDDGDHYKLNPSSRRLVQWITPKGKVLRTYELREDGKTRLFTLASRTAENGNDDICVINLTSKNMGEIIVLHVDGWVRATYRGQEGSNFHPSDVACDSKRRIVVSDFTNKSLHLLNPSGSFLRYLLSDMFDYPMRIAFYDDILWIGFEDGAVQVYKYS